MWYYDKKLEYPINIKKCDPRMAKYIITQYGGPDGELAASLRYLSQRFHMPTKETQAILNDIGISLSKKRILIYKFTDNFVIAVFASTAVLQFYWKRHACK